MPYRLDENRAKIQFTTSAAMPNLIYQACLATGTVSNTVYIQHAVLDALARDLPQFRRSELEAQLPPPRGPSKHLFNPDDHTMDRTTGRTMNLTGIALDQTGGRTMIGPANTVEEVR